MRVRAAPCCVLLSGWSDMPLVLWLLVLLSALVQVGVSHHHRELLQQWQQQDARRMALQQEYSRLVLERSTLSAHGRLDLLARKQLNMTDPKQVQVLRK